MAEVADPEVDQYDEDQFEDEAHEINNQKELASSDDNK